MQQVENCYAFRGIFVYPVVKSYKVLRFRDVPKSAEIVVTYGVDDNSIKEKERSHVYLRIYAGKHMIKRLRIPNVRGWKQFVLDMGVVPFLNRPIALSVDVTADVEEGQFFYFDVEIIKRLK